MDEDSLPKVDCPDSNIQRQYDVMQGFAKALWVVLKQYKERVKVKNLRCYFYAFINFIDFF